ncbi:condensation domain-containing protein, partial [Bacillus sp. SD088]|uniref:condensation domain-containing protein n=1 Tax=Bacillus sp. SD088 TaxID=2782012 RepID=UPI001A958EF8
KVEEQAYYPVSSQQKRLYLIHEMGEQGTVYNMPALLELAGQLDREKVEQACAQLSARHEALRTTFTVVDGESVQQIASALPIEVEWSEHESLDEAQAQAAFTDFVRPFDLAHGPLFRVKVLQGPTNSYLFFDMHHIISDGESINILTKEFSELYNGVELAPLTVHYKDYSHWLAQKDLQAQEDYWVGQF